MKPILFIVIVSVLLPFSPALGTIEDEQEGEQIKVMIFNVLHNGGNAERLGFYEKDFPGSRAQHIIKVVQQCDPDFLMVQEGRGSWIAKGLGEGWHQSSQNYGRRPLEDLHVGARFHTSKTRLDNGRVLVLANEHWTFRNGYGPYMIHDLVEKKQRDAKQDEVDMIAERVALPEEYRGAIKRVEPYLDTDAVIVIGGDFNEPSHLDWTQRYADQGKDRWASDSDVKRKYKVAWQGSQVLAKAGFVDAYRKIHPDEVKHPGNTWTPPYDVDTPGRQHPDSVVHDRIDMVYVYGKRVKILDCQVVGENEKTSDIVCTPWPSDHRAVLVTLEIASD